MRPGLRIQLLLILGALLVVAFVPLFFALSTFLRFSLRELRAESARTLGRAIAGHITEARSQRSFEQLVSLARAEVGVSGVEAIGVYDARGEPELRLGDVMACDAIRGPLRPGKEATFDVIGSHGRALVVVVPDDRGQVAVVLRTDTTSAGADPIVRFVALYTGLVALAVLIVGYVALTVLIVAPLGALSHAARRVAEGARRFDVPTGGPREVVLLSESLRTMTERLVTEEEALRRKVVEIEKATAELAAAQEGLVRSERLASVGRLSAGFAHEVGNPLAALIGMQDLLLGGGLEPSEQQDLINRMRRETERIHRIIRDLLQFARPQRGQSEETASPGDVENAVSETQALVRPQPGMRDVVFAVDVAPNLPRVSLATDQLVQLLLNLVLNAGDAVGSGGRILVRASREGGEVRIEIIDDGPGVDPKVMDVLFEPFVTTKEVGRGTGLGLAVCRGLVEGAGGRISLDRTHAPGARFVVEVPVANERAFVPSSRRPRS